jgi:hypothetical protein
VLVLIAGGRRVRWSVGERAWQVPVYGIGSIAAYWTIARIAAFRSIRFWLQQESRG